MEKSQNKAFLLGCKKDYQSQLKNNKDKEHVSELKNCISDIDKKLAKLK